MYNILMTIFCHYNICLNLGAFDVVIKPIWYSETECFRQTVFLNVKLVFIKHVSRYIAHYNIKDSLGLHSFPSSLAKGFAHGPLSLRPWQIELKFRIHALSITI